MKQTSAAGRCLEIEGLKQEIMPVVSENYMVEYSQKYRRN